MKKIAFVIISGIILIASCSKKSSVPTASGLPAATVFDKNCARCHGATGTEGKAPNLAETKLDKAGLLDIITNGRDKMPAFDKRLAAVDIEAVTTFVHGLKK